VVITCRHGITDSFDENEATLRYDDDATQRKLTPRGERQAGTMGRALRALRIPIAGVVSSPMQRARSTASLLGLQQPVTLDSAWHTRGTNYTGWKNDRRIEHLSRVPREGNRLIVSHIGTMQFTIKAIRELQEGDCFVVRPRGDDGFEPVGLLRWRHLLRAADISDSIP
jgi:broad specificity phosphatase PhoE